MSATIVPCLPSSHADDDNDDDDDDDDDDDAGSSLRALSASIYTIFSSSSKSKLDRLKEAQAAIEAEIAVSEIQPPPTSTALAIESEVDIILALIMGIMQAGVKAPTAKVLTAGLQKSSVPLSDLNERNAAMLAKTFSLCVLFSQSPEAAADQLIGNSVAVRELMEKHRKFRPKLVLTAEQAMSKNTLGASFRLFFGAGLSMFDFVTDVVMIRDYFLSEQVQQAWMLLGMLLTNLTLNLLLSWLQNRKKGWKAVAKDCLLVLSYLKPGVDAWKVASGAAHAENSMMTPTVEMLVCKCAELVSESIPGTILQVTAFLTAKGARTDFQVFSICTSILTTAFTSTIISFDMDTNPLMRRTNSFYGYVPDGNKVRLKVFLLMLLAMTAHVTSSSMGMALLFATSPSSAGLYLATSMSVYLLYRVCRGDLHYWMPVDGKLGWLFSIWCRVAIKLIVDFTGCIQLRHPQELGGMYYTFSLLQAQVASAMFTQVYVDASHDNVDAIASSALYSFGAVVSATWVCSYALFFAHIKTGFAATFVDVRSAIKSNEDRFNDCNALDLTKVEIVTKHPGYWHSIEPDIRKFLSVNWAKWEQEKPEWFTMGIISNIPSDMLPESARSSQKRRPSVLEKFVGVFDSEEEEEDNSEKEGV